MESIGQFFSSIAWWAYIIAFLVILFIRDILQKKHTIQHNFPVIGHLRYFIESVGPELRQYIVANNREELPFNRRQRSWIYASSKKENNFQGFGTDQDMYSAGYNFIKPALLPYKLPKGHPNLENPYICPSAKVVGCYHNTGEGGLSPYHKNGADVVLNIGTAYFGIRDDDGNFVLDKLVRLCQDNPCIKMIELKLSQGAKPGKGGVLPASKLTKELAEIRHVPMGKDVISPAYHSAFSDIKEMIDFIELMANATGLPVGINSAVGKLEMLEELADLMKKTGKGPDFITIDGGEGGTGAAPPSFADHVSLPFVYAFSSVYRIFQKRELNDKITFIGSGKLGLPDTAIMAFSMGVDVINVGRESMLSIGCIQAQVCHTNRCPSGVATQNKWLQGGIDPTLKSERFYNYVKTLTKEILDICHACGYEHPSQFMMDDVDVAMGDNNRTQSLRTTYQYQKTPVKFEGLKKLLESPYLGGKN